MWCFARLLPFAQFKKRKKLMRSSVTFSKVVGLCFHIKKIRNRDQASDRKFCMLLNQNVQELWRCSSCVFIESITSLTAEKRYLTNKVNYTTGESVGGSWTDKILDNKDTKTLSHLTQDSVAVEDDEWVCSSKLSLANIEKLLYETLCATWYHLNNFKNLKNTHGGVFSKVAAF